MNSCLKKILFVLSGLVLISVGFLIGKPEVVNTNSKKVKIEEKSLSCIL